jgi:glutathione peroxidase
MTVTDIALTTLDGNPTSLADYGNQAVLVVNVASKCGLTPQYAALEQLAKNRAPQKKSRPFVPPRMA